MTTDAQLDTLEAKGLIRLATLQPELEYLFRHALVQDAAYESLLKQERRELHHSVGEALESLYPDRRGELASLLARHFEQAGDNSRAVPYLMEAAKFAYDRNAIVEAYELYGRAAALLPPAAPTDPDDLVRQRIAIEIGRVKSGFSFLSDAEQIQLLEPMVEHVERLGDLRLEADVHINLALIRQFRGARSNDPLVKHSLQRVTQIADELNDPVLAALPQSLVGLFQVFSGDIEEGVATLRKVAPILEGNHAFVGSSFAHVALAMGLSRLGRFDEALEAATRASKLAESGDLIAKLDSLIGESAVRSMRGDLEGAIPIAMQCTALSEETGATACVVASNFVLGDAYARQGKFQSAQIAFERSNEVAETFQEHGFRPSVMAYLRSNAANMGQFGQDMGDFDRALELARESDDRWSEATVVWKRAEYEATRGNGNREQMLAGFSAAADGFEKMGARPMVARVLRDWGVALRDTGQRDDGDEKLRRALALFDEMGIKREGDEVRQLLSVT